MVSRFLDWPVPGCRVLTCCSDRSSPFSHTFGSRLFGSPQQGQPTLLLSARPLAFDFSPRKSSVRNRVHVTAALRCCSDLAAQESLTDFPSNPITAHGLGESARLHSEWQTFLPVQTGSQSDHQLAANPKPCFSRSDHVMR